MSDEAQTNPARSCPAPPTEDFSLVLGGPLYQLYLRLRAVKPPLELFHRRIVGLTLIVWLPLVVLTALAGTLWKGVPVPFLLDAGAQCRLLLSLPLLIVAEVVVHQRLKTTVGEFIERGIVVPKDQPRLNAIVARTMRWRNAVLVEIALIAIAWAAGDWLWRERISQHADTWYVAGSDAGVRFSPAGFWYEYVSLPIVRFMALRRYYRILLWYAMLWRISRLPLHLNPLHPDRAGGLGFLSESVFAFAPVLVAHSVLLAGLIGDDIWHRGARLPEYQLEIIGIVVGLALFVLAPLTFFLGQLAHARRVGRREYGLVASHYVDDFQRKWLERGLNQDALLGTADIQSLADLSNSFEVVEQMRTVPFNSRTVLVLGIAIAAPLLPLTLTMIPLRELIQRALGMFL